MTFISTILIIIGAMFLGFLLYILILLYQALTIYIKKNKDEVK
jgi:uncharacterized membrane protein